MVGSGDGEGDSTGGEGDATRAEGDARGAGGEADPVGTLLTAGAFPQAVEIKKIPARAQLPRRMFV